jgi:ribosomal protein L4
VKVLRPEGLNVYDILKYEYLLLTKQSAEKIQERLRQ